MKEKLNAKYRVKIEQIEGDTANYDTEFAEGYECEGFAFILTNGDKSSKILIHNTSIENLSAAIAASDSILPAAILGKAKRKALEIIINNNSKNAIERIKAKLQELQDEK